MVLKPSSVERRWPRCSGGLLALALVLALSACGVEPLTSESIFSLGATPRAWLVGTVYDRRTSAPLEGVVVATTTTDARGAFRLDPVPVGRFTATAVKEGYAAFAVDAEVHAGANRVDLALAPLACGGCGAGEVCGRDGQCALSATFSSDVVSACNGAALSAKVTLGGHSVCSNGGKGYFVLYDLPPGGPQTLAVGKEGYAVFSKPVTLVSGFNVVEAIALTPLGGCGAPTPTEVPCTCTEPSCQ